jgi:hypothetical protein
MTLRELVLEWDNEWRYDYWWRKKYNIPFNSERHREANQIDIAFEFMENQITNESLDQLKLDEENKKMLERGEYIRSNFDEKKQKELFDKMDISNL